MSDSESGLSDTYGPAQREQLCVKFLNPFLCHEAPKQEKVKPVKQPAPPLQLSSPVSNMAQTWVCKMIDISAEAQRRLTRLLQVDGLAQALGEWV